MLWAQVPEISKGYSLGPSAIESASVIVCSGANWFLPNAEWEQV